MGREADPPLAGADLAPNHPRGRGPRRPRLRIEDLGWRALAVIVALAEIALLVWLADGPALRIHRVTISGGEHLAQKDVLAASGLDRGRSVLLVDGASVQRRLEKLTWVRTATVQPLLPDRVAVTIQEWRPVALYRVGPTGRPYYLSDQGIALGPSETASGLPLLEGPGPADPRVGTRAVEPQLLAALVRIDAVFPSIYGQPVARFNIDCVGALSLTTERGVRILFGRVLTPEEFSSLGTKLSSLKSVAATDPDVRNPDKVEYINLENAQQPAVKFKGARPPATPAPSPSPSPAAGVTPAPAKPSPTAPTLEVPACR